MQQSGGLPAAIEEQRLLVAQHAPEDAPAFERVVDVLPALRNRLGLGRFLGALVIDHKPRALYRFLVAENSRVAALGRQVVLKVYADRARGEGPLQQLWRSRGVGVPRLVCGEERDCSWLVLEHLDMHPVADFPVDQLEFVALLARMAMAMHRPTPDVMSSLRPLDEVIVPRWKDSVLALRRCGYNIPSSWLNRAVAAYVDGDALPLHGDLAPANMGRSRSGRLIVFDASALRGTSFFDAARWAARVGPGGAGPEALLRRWTSVEGGPSVSVPWELLAAECVLEAGARQIVRLRTARGGPGAPRSEVDPGVPELLGVAAQQWS